MGELEGKMWLLTFHFLNFSFLIDKIGLRGNEKGEGLGEWVVNRISSVSKGQ